MRAARRHVCLLLVLAVVGATPMFAADAAAQTAAAGQPPATRADAARKRPSPENDPATTLLQLQAIVGRMAGSSELAPDDARELARVMSIARGRTISEKALHAFSIQLALAAAEGAFDDESIERLAQDLFAAANSRALTEREALLLMTDVATLLREAGAASGSIDAVLAAFAPVAGIESLPVTTPAQAGRTRPTFEPLTRRAR